MNGDEYRTPRPPRMSRRVLRGFSPSHLVTARTMKRLSRGELARLVGVSRNAVDTWEVGRSTPQADTLKKVAYVLEVPMTELIRIDPNERYIGDLRTLRGLTQPQLASLVGAASSTIAEIERGQARLTDSMAQRFAEALNVSEANVRDSYERARTRPAHTAP